MRWVDGTVTVEDSVASSTSFGGDLLRITFLPSITTVTLGLIRMRDRSLCLGPVRLIMFGPPKMSSTSVSWPIDGGLLVASAGGRFTIESAGGELRATLDGYNPMLPRSVYEATQLRRPGARCRAAASRARVHRHRNRISPCLLDDIGQDPGRTRDETACCLDRRVAALARPGRVEARRAADLSAAALSGARRHRRHHRGRGHGRLAFQL